MIGIFLLAFTLSLFSFGTTPAAAGNVAGVRTHLFLTVLRDYDHDAAFSVTYTDALGTHTKPYHAGMEVTAWSPVTITCTNHHVDDWSIDADVQEATIVGVGGITYPGGTGIHVKGTNTIKAFATNFGLHYINIVVILGEGNDNGGDNGNVNDPHKTHGNEPKGKKPDKKNPSSFSTSSSSSASSSWAITSAATMAAAITATAPTPTIRTAKTRMAIILTGIILTETTRTGMARMATIRTATIRTAASRTPPRPATHV